MKRKADQRDVQSSLQNNGKRQALDASSHFRTDLFHADIISQHANDYAQSGPYKHAVISNLISDDLLRAVRNGIVENIHFTPKETDIYKIHQSGDLANLDGLPASALEKLPSLLKLRDAMYSAEFREWVSRVSGAGALSGQKTDMAVNVYVPGCHLLCHDDVIGSRRVSYILYLTDPDVPWQAEWGGALRLFPTDNMKGADGKDFKLPKSDWSKSVPPAWNQLSFFAVQPGESFHDVEEVYAAPETEARSASGRTRMAISGWFHIPQEGETGYEAGLEEKLAEKSSLQQLQGKADLFDEPQHQWITPDEESHTEDEDDDLTEQDLQFLLRFMTPNYLTPDTVEELNELFTDESILQLTDFLNKKFSESLQASMQDLSAPQTPFQTSRPPHKHHYQYAQPQSCSAETPFTEILTELLPSLSLKKWLSLVTGLSLKRSAVLARRFRKGIDYQLAQGYEGEDPQLEYTLCVTPTTGWTREDDGETEAAGNSNLKTEGRDTADDDNLGGYELYMAGDDPDDAEGSDDGVTIPPSAQSHTGAGDRRSAKKRKADPAIYQAAADDEDDGILFSNPAGWNTMSIVLRDKGTLKFVKYVSNSAPGDRYDFTGCVEVEPEDEGDEEREDVKAVART